MAEAVRARRVQQLGVLEGGHDGEEGVEPGVRLGRAGVTGGGERVQRAPYVRESSPRLAARPGGAVLRRDGRSPRGPPRRPPILVRGDALGGDGDVLPGGPVLQGRGGDQELLPSVMSFRTSAPSR
jgi:hypothetical protein